MQILNLRRYQIVGLWSIFFLGLLVLGGCSSQRVAEAPVFKEHESGITYRLTHEAGGIKPSINDQVFVHYTLMLEDSTVIDSSLERGEPIYFKVGAGQVIKGWDIAMTLFGKGDRVVLIIPPELGYGDRQMASIPENSTLVFDVEIVDVIPAPEPFQISDNIQRQTTPAGVDFAILEAGSGKKLQSGMRVKVHYSGFFTDMSLFDSSLERGQPIEIVLGRGMVIKGWEEGLKQLSVGDRARLWIPYHLAYGEQGRGPIAPRSDLIFDVEILSAEEIPGATPFNVAGKDTLSTESGLQYIVVEEGNGVMAQPGNRVAVHYSGFLTDGTMFDSSVERDEPFRFTLGQGQVIPGWDEGIALMQINARFRLIVPYQLAYGKRGAGPIPPESTLIFDVHLLAIE